MADVPYAYGYQNQVRDVTAIMDLIRQQSPRLLSLVEVAPYLAKNHKHEWPEDIVAPESTTIAAAAAANATTLTVTSKLPFCENALFRVEGTEEILRVTAVSAVANEITVVRAYGGTTAAAIANGKRLTITTKPQNESSDPDNTHPGGQPDIAYNYSEIFEGKAVVSKTQDAIYGIGDPASTDPVGDALNYQLEKELIQIANRTNAGLIYGRRSARTRTIPGTMGGLLQFHEGGNLVNAANAAVNEKILGEAFQKCLDGGADMIDTMLCGPEQAYNISQLYKANLQILRQDTTLGTVIYQVQAGLPIQGYITTIAVDPQFPKNAISIFARKRIKLTYKRRMTDEDSRPPGADYVARRILGEMTAEFRNWKETAVLIKQLSTERL